VLVDPKKVELTLFNKIERHFLAKLPDEEEAIITDTSKVVKTLNSLCIEMDERYHLLKPGQKILDLGAAPGGWSQYAVKKVGPKGRVIGIDLLDIDPIAGVEFTIMDFLEEDAPDRLKDMLGGLADGVMSDMAANTTGHKKTDHLKIIGLAELAIHFATEVLAPGGFFVAKVFQGGTEGDLLTLLKRDFKTVRHVKPEASRAGSAELYVLATGFRGIQRDED
jgi:23S rRNA (uridine2552-2'-O)-methyltransferase